MKLNRPLLLAWLAWLLFFPMAAAVAQDESAQEPGVRMGFGLLIGLVLIGLAFALARQKNRD